MYWFVFIKHADLPLSNVWPIAAVTKVEKCILEVFADYTMSHICLRICNNEIKSDTPFKFRVGAKSGLIVKVFLEML